MDFFEQQDVARRKTGWLIAYFIAAVVAIVLAVYFVALIAMVFVGGDPDNPSAPNPYEENPFQPGLFIMVGLGTIGVISLGSLYKISQLSAGGEAVALMLGGRRLNRQTNDLAERRLLNVVEEMALASGTPVPPVYVMDKEASINAFAAGNSPGDAVIGVSKGSLDYLTRDELQGVMAHEFSHITNGDMRMNLRLMGVLHGILIIAIIGWFAIRSMQFSGGRRSSKNDGGGAFLILAVGVGLLIIGSIGLLFGKLIKSAVSRQREYLADASAVQFTRLPEGIAGALKKIGGRKETSKIEDPHAEEVSHMFFGNAFGSLASGALSTHPPLAERVKRIDPQFNGKFPKVKPLGARKPVSRSKTKGKQKKGKPVQVLAGAGMPGGRSPVDPAGVFGQIGVPGMEQLLYAAALIESMPEPVTTAVHEPYGARAVVYALLLDRQESIRQKQLDVLKQRAEEVSYKETLRVAPLVAGLAEEARVPLVEMSFPALKELSPAQYDTFRCNVTALVEADEKIDLFEYVVRTMLFGDLDRHFGRAKPVSIRYRHAAGVVEPVTLVLSLLARVGHQTEEEARRALEAGMTEVGQSAALLPKDQCTLKALDGALETLAQAAPKVKKQILGACVACIAADREVTPKEGELLRVVAAVLGCPVPPVPNVA
ncbi:MAG: M48 family metallopeptidase [Planctomycetes bacterium]|nr:M48 family metallopeptidase [Planctomycetota bacterium]